MIYDEDDYQFYQVKDAMLLCDSNTEALQLATAYSGMVRYLATPFRYYLYTVHCRRTGTFAVSPQLWAKEHS